MDLLFWAVIIGAVTLVSALGYLFGPGALVVFWIGLKTVIGYGWRFLAPIWVVVKSKKWYKIGAIFLTFGSFLLHFYSFMKTGDTSLLNTATNALAATINGSLQELVQSGKVLIGTADLKKKGFAVFLFLAAFARIYLYFLGWKMLKKRVPELTYYLLVSFSFYLLTWGSQDANTLFQAFDFAQTAADQAASQAGQQMVNSTLTG